MATCDYIYVSGLRVESGAAVVVVEGRRLRVVRTGKGRSRLDRPATSPPSDGEITLKDLKALLPSSSKSSANVTIHTPYGEFRAVLDPERAMGRKGREGSFTDALNAMSPAERVIAAKYQLTTLPYGKQNVEVARARLDEAVKRVGIAACVDVLPPNFSDIASPELLAEALRATDTTTALRLAGDRVPFEMFRNAIDVAPFDVMRDTLGRIDRSRVMEFSESLAVRYPERFLEIRNAASLSRRSKKNRALEDAVLESIKVSHAGPDSPLPAVVREALTALDKNPKDDVAREWLLRLSQLSPATVFEEGASRRLPKHYLDRAVFNAPVAALDNAAAHLSPDQILQASILRPVEALTRHVNLIETEEQVGYVFETVAATHRHKVLTPAVLERMPIETWHRFVESRELIDPIAADGSLGPIIDACSDEQFALLASRNEDAVRSHPRFDRLATLIAEVNPLPAPSVPLLDIDF